MAKKKEVWIELTCKAGFKQEGINEVTATLKGPHGERDIAASIVPLWNLWWRVVTKDNDQFLEGQMVVGAVGLEGEDKVWVQGKETLTLLDVAETLKEVTSLPIRCVDGEGKEAKVEELD